MIDSLPDIKDDELYNRRLGYKIINPQSQGNNLIDIYKTSKSSELNNKMVEGDKETWFKNNKINDFHKDEV
jgi:hypothetical protein